jgi:hypothetical protein
MTRAVALNDKGKQQAPQPSSIDFSQSGNELWATAAIWTIAFVVIGRIEHGSATSGP